MHTINIALQFTTTTGARVYSDGPFSGEEFREKFLEPLFKDGNDDSKIKIILDGTEGYDSSFLDEAFGGLARRYGIDRCLDRFEFISNEEPLLIEEIKGYIKKGKKS